MHETQRCLVVPIQEELSQTAAVIIQQQILERVHARPLIGVVIDLAGVQIIDSALWTTFINTSRMIKVMGVPSVLTGLNPGAVASIIDLQLDCDEIETAMQLEDALTMLTRGCPDPSELELEPAPEATPAEADPTTNTAIDASNDAQ
jgi:rsbT antagonist protein RsbS